MHEPCSRSILTHQHYLPTKIPKEIPHLSNPTSSLIPPISLFFVAIKTPESFAVFVLVMTNGSHSGNASNTFEAFYEGWLVRQEHFFDELLSAQQTIDEARDEDLQDLVSRVLLHYQQYYDEKLQLGQLDVLLLFSPTWHTSYERSLLWIAGYKLGIVFRLVTELVPDLSDQQRVKMARLREATRVEERALNDKLAKIHESVAAPPFMDAVRRYGRAGHGEIAEDDTVIKSLKSVLETVVENANLLRTTMATKLVDLLSSGQAVKFFTAVMQFQLKIRSLGLERDAKKQLVVVGVQLVVCGRILSFILWRKMYGGFG